MMKINYSNFRFDKTAGLFYDDQPIADFNLTLIKKKSIWSLSATKTDRFYLIEAAYTDSRSNRQEWVHDLKKMNLFEIFEIDDNFLSTEEHKLLLSKLMYEAGQASEQIFTDSRNGLQEIKGNMIYIMGEHVLQSSSFPDMPHIITHNIMGPIKYTDKEEIAILCNSYITLLPGTTEILFFASLFAVVKPFLGILGIPSGFLLLLAGPPGHLKTTMARLYALWYEEKSELENSFYSSQREQAVLKTLDGLSGQNFLIDDLHKISDTNASRRQERRLDIVSRHVNSKFNCANVILTGEPMEHIGIFSCMDRIFQLKIPKMDAQEIEDLKLKVSALPSGLMPSIALAFAQSLIDNYDKTLTDIKDFYTKNSVDNNASGYATRIYRHALFIRMTEFLFKKHFELIFPIFDGQSAFDQAIAMQISQYQADLQKICSNEEVRDYIADLHHILNADGKHIKICSTPEEYGKTNMENSCLIYTGKIYITTASLKNAIFSYYKKYVETKLFIDALHSEGILEEESGSKGRQKNYMKRKHYIINYNIFKYYMEKKSHKGG